ncbi:hypothetical protein Tco_0841047 [Tanacetum coccineum]|uniref:Uncharacterized protein n=1 Tax=Tanacetum coccineum TaxID=301880 RepID=A0ABQ5AVL7_9ASTR
MHQEQAQQAARDEKLVPTEDIVKIGKSNLIMDPTLTQKKETYQVILDIIKNTPYYNAFLISADVLEIYMQQFWFTIKKVKKSSFYQFDLDNKTCIYHKENVDYAALIWEDLQYQIDNRQSKVRRREIMPYPRFTKVIIHHFMSQHKSISKRQGSPYNTVNKDGVLDRLKFIAYKMFIFLSTGLIPPKIERGKGAQGSKATVTPKKATAASKKKRSDKIESSDEESYEQEERIIKRKPRAIFIQDSLQKNDTQKAIKASKRESIFKHQSGGSSEGAGITLEVLDEPIGKSAVLDEGAGTSPEVPNETKDKSKAQDDLVYWGSTDDETFLFDEKEENPRDIPSVSTDEDESDDDDEEDDESIDIKMTDDVKTDTDVEDLVKGVAKMNITEEAEEENAKKVEEQKADEVLKADEEQQGDDQVGDEQVGVPVSTTHKETPNLLQSTSSHSVSSNFGNQFLNSPNVSLIEPFHAVKVSVIPEPTEIPPSTPPAPLLPATVIPSALVPNPEAFNDVSKVPEAVNKYLGPTLGDTLRKDDVSKFIKVKQELDAKENNEHKQKNILFQSLLVDENDMDKLVVDPASQRKRRHDDKDQDPPAGSDLRMKKKRTRKDAEPSKKSLKSKESAKDTIPKIPKKDWFKKSPRPKILDPDWNTVKTIDDAPEQSWFNEMIQAEKHLLMFDELMSTPIDFSEFAMNRLKLNKITRADLVVLMFNLLKGTCKRCVELEYNMEECYHTLTDKLDWTNPKGHKSSVYMSKPLPLHDKEVRLTIPVEFFFNNDLEYLKARNKERTYSSSITKTPAARYTMEGIKDMIPTLWIPVKISYDKDVALEISHWSPQRQQYYRAMINRVSKHEVFSTMRILSVVSVQVEKKSGYGYLKEIVVRRADQKLYKFKEGYFSDLHLNDIEDMLLLIARNKLFNLEGDLGVESYQRKLNLTKPERTCPHISVKEPYTLNFDPHGVIYEDKSKKKRLMRVDEIHKFCDGTL